MNSVIFIHVHFPVMIFFYKRLIHTVSIMNARITLQSFKYLIKKEIRGIVDLAHKNDNSNIYYSPEQILNFNK